MKIFKRKQRKPAWMKKPQAPGLSGCCRVSSHYWGDGTSGCDKCGERCGRLWQEPTPKERYSPKPEDFAGYTKEEKECENCGASFHGAHCPTSLCKATFKKPYNPNDDTPTMMKTNEGAPPSANHPTHYTVQIPGIECWDVTQHFNFNRGNIIKYAWRCGAKGGVGDAIKDLRKCIEYAKHEIERIQKENGGTCQPERVEPKAEDNIRLTSCPCGLANCFCANH